MFEWLLRPIFILMCDDSAGGQRIDPTSASDFSNSIIVCTISGDIYVLVAAFLVPYFGCNVISLVVFLIVYCKLGDFKNNMDGLFEG